MDYQVKSNYIFIKKSNQFNTMQILNSGQVFRYEMTTFGYKVYSGRQKAEIYCQKDGTKIISNNIKYFIKYFDLDENYDTIKMSIKGNNFLDEAIKYGYGIRILKQDLVETIISFIISANNNIPRIKATITKLCNEYGDKIEDYYSFPTIEQLSKIPLQFFNKIGCGYRSKYLIETIQMLNFGFDLDKINYLDSDGARKYLMQLKGVGSKVADCILLFAYSKKDVFPTDTWIKKIYKENYGGNLSSAKDISKYFVDLYKLNSGIVQQYLFYFKREEKVKEKKL